MKYSTLDFLLYMGVILLFSVLLCGFLYGAKYLANEPYENACIDYGFESYYGGGFSSVYYCVDKEGNLHTVSFEKESFMKYKVKEIKVYSYGEFVPDATGEEVEKDE